MKWSLGKKEHLVWAAFIAPAFLIYTVIFLGPVITSFYYSMTNWNGLYKTMDFVGLQNFTQLVSDDKFLRALRNTFWFTLLVVILQNGLAMPLAMALDSKIKSKSVLRAAFFVPAILSPLVVGYTWMYIYQPDGGLLNELLAGLGLGSWQQSWLGDPAYALYGIVAIVLWQFVGYSMVIFIANLQTIPGDYYEAADIDGAGGWRKFLSITFPLMAPSITINVVLASIGSLKAFDIIYVTTKGGPYYATETFTTLLYRTAFTESSFGYGTAIGVVMFFIILMISFIQIVVLRRREVGV
ncbi:sugar ABC transporter permease [Paenibacillus pasadenensis]|uniref:carbohydrate ABC transporter permease n=1 Tax=Paenibacillus pasadenensis TaxID=217090 RepID=UPI00203C0A75|nr:sugar ABC transporter permease [Paenibacillus pasadenensis]MCM3747022.1 sugar ABC transporter permease [Paenibacillus pasadenensis]